MAKAGIVRRLGLGALAALCLAPALAQEFPSRPITIVVPFPPGGSAEALMRPIAERIRISTSQPVIIDSRPGGGGNVGAVFVKNAAPDGYTLFLGHNGTHGTNPALYADLRYDPVKDFAPITTLMSFPSVLVVPTASPAKSLHELAALAKSKPGGLSYASQGVGSSGHLLGEMFRSLIGTPLVHVPYRGAAAATTDLMTGRVDMFFAAYLSVGAQVTAGNLRALAITSTKRSPTLPDVPTVAEAGFPTLEIETWFGIMAPAGTPAPVVRKLHQEFVAAAHTPELMQLVTSQAAEIVTRTPEEFSALILRDMERLGKAVREAGIRIE